MIETVEGSIDIEDTGSGDNIKAEFNRGENFIDKVIDQARLIDERPRMASPFKRGAPR